MAVSIGNKASAETLRTALAMGADRAIHIETTARTDQEVQPLAVAKTLKFIADVRSSHYLLNFNIILTVSFCMLTVSFCTERESRPRHSGQAVYRC